MDRVGRIVTGWTLEGTYSRWTFEGTETNRVFEETVTNRVFEETVTNRDGPLEIRGPATTVNEGGERR
ncbi:hypothetical protein [Natrialba swarupiae]|uniref:Uncharacterized protein n=1 Tax=Natrialba swarupiae TaxID=2448032 RepID=A0A5D5ASE2_9EURY|nr:hypothetical protein [Natrialba swarupiae]TYT63963.1 hypothetical protein FYC77_01800 [Natrialba swarupiae]